MKKLLSIIFVFAVLFAKAQTGAYTLVNGNWEYKFVKVDSGYRGPVDTLASAPISATAVKGTTLYIKGSDGFWHAITGAGGSGVWGFVSGSLPAQTDLAAKFGTKYDTTVRKLDTLYAITDSTLGFYTNGLFHAFKFRGTLTSFNGRNGAIVLTLTDVSSAIGFVPANLSSVINALQVVNAGGATSIRVDVIANRPAAGTFGRMFIATDALTLTVDNGTSWLTIAGGGGSGVSTASGDASGTAVGTNLPLTLATVNSNTGVFGDASHIAQFTANAKGLITAAVAVSIQISESQVTNLVSDLAGKQATGNYITALTGDVTAAGPGSAAATIAANTVTNAKAAQMGATTIKANVTGSTANAADATPAQIAAILPVFSTSANGLAPTSPGGTIQFLRADGSYAVPPGTGGTTFANPTGTTGLTAVNGSASTAMRSDAAPPLSQAIVPTWTGVHTFSLAPIFSALTGYLKGNGASAITASSTIPTTDLSGTLAAAQEPAHTGDVTNTAGSLAMTIANNAVTTAKIIANAVTLAKQATNAANTLQGFDASGNPVDVAIGSGVALSGNTLTGTGGSSFDSATSQSAAASGAFHTDSFNVRKYAHLTGPLGYLYNKSVFSSGIITSDFTNTSLTFTASGSAIAVSGTGNGAPSTTTGTANTIAHYSRLTAYGATGLERNKYYIDFTLTSAPAAGSGVGIGWASISTHYTCNLFAALDFTSGKVIIMSGTTNATDTVSTFALPTISNGDAIRLIVERKEDQLFVTAVDNTTGGVVQTSYRFDFSNILTMPNPNNTANMAIIHGGGAYNITAVSAYSDEQVGGNVCVVMDSKGSYDASYDVGLPRLLNRVFRGTISNSGAGDASAEVVAKLPELAALHYKTYVVAVSNDLRFSITTGTWQANLTNINSTLAATGANVVWLDALYETSGLNQSALISYIHSNFTYIPTFAVGESTDVTAAGIHQNQQGNYKVSRIVINSPTMANTQQLINGIQDDRPLTASFNKVNNYGVIIDPEAAFFPPYLKHDIVLRDGASIMASSISGIYSQIRPARTGAAALDIINSQGGANDATSGVSIWTPNGAGNGVLGFPTMRFGNGGIMMIMNAVQGFSAAAGDIYGTTTTKFGAANSTSSGNEGYFQPYASGNTIINNTKVGAGYILLQRGGTTYYALDNAGYSSFNSVTGPYQIARVQSEDNTNPQLGLFYNSTHSATFKVNSTSNLDIEGLTGLTINSGALPTGTTTDSVLVETTSANVATIKKVAQSSIGGGGGGTPGGSVGNFQYNNTTFAGFSGLTTDGTNLFAPTINGASGASSTMVITPTTNGSPTTARVQLGTTTGFIYDQVNKTISIGVTANASNYPVMAVSAGVNNSGGFQLRDGYTSGAVNDNFLGTDGNLGMGFTHNYNPNNGAFLNEASGGNQHWATGMWLGGSASAAGRYSVFSFVDGSASRNYLQYVPLGTQNLILAGGTAPTDNHAFLQTPASTTTNASFLLPEGTAPTTLTAGQVYAQSSDHNAYWVDNTLTPRCMTCSASDGIYLPTKTNGSNATSGLADSATWSRSGNTITVFGQAYVVGTSTGGCDFYLSLPVASTLSASSLHGLATSMLVSATATGYMSDGQITADVTNNRAHINFAVNVAGQSDTFYYSYQYTVRP